MLRFSQYGKDQPWNHVLESKGKIVTLRISKDLYQVAKTRIAELGTSFQQVLVDLLEEWLEEGMSGPRTGTRPAGGMVSKTDSVLIAKFLDFWRNPHDPVDLKLRKLLAEVLEVREKHAKDRRKSTA